MEKNNQSVDIKSLSKEQRAALMAQLQQEEKEDRIARRETYEALRGEFMHEVKTNVLEMVNAVTGFRGWLEKEADAFTKVMKEYGQVKSDEQRSYTITDGDFRLEVKSNKVKGFDDRADMAADRLIDYLKRYMQNSEKGSDDPMYQMAMTLLERNGLINKFFGLFGIGPFEMINTSGAVVLGMVYNYLPFMILPIYSVIIKLDGSLLEAARDLGASSMTVFRRVILPLSLPGVISGITMVFVPSVSTFAISRMLGGGTELLLGDLIERQFLGGAYNPQLGAAISLVMMVIVLVCMLVMNRFGEGEEQAVIL